MKASHKRLHSAYHFRENLHFILTFLVCFTPCQVTARWVLLVVVVLAYIAHVWMLRGFYIVSYGLGIYNLNLLLGFITPQFDYEQEGPELPTNLKADEDFKPFVRRLPEFKFW